MIKIAFASCFSAQICPSQPVWKWIEAEKPDYLVLLGDSIYLDVSTPDHPMLMTDDEFAKHLFARYTAQLAVPEFKSLIQSMGKNRVYSLWDDHDFLWNDENGADAWGTPIKRSKIVISSAFQHAYRQALAAGLAPKSFPSAYNAKVFWETNHCPAATPSIHLAQEDVWLHVTDGRTHRTRTWAVEQAKRTLLGAAQKAALAAAYAQSSPTSVHLFASGSVMGDYKKSYPVDWAWLMAQADTRRTLALTGDIHRNARDEFANTKLPLYEATSSGAAVKELVVAGNDLANHGMLTIDDTHVTVNLFESNQQQPELNRRLVRKTWAPG